MINLQDICGLPLVFDDLQNRLHISNPVSCSKQQTVPLSSMIYALLNKAVRYPTEVYEEYSVCLECDKDFFGEEINFDLMVLPAGLLGIEFIKSHVFYAKANNPSTSAKFSTIIEGIQGETTIIMQKNGVQFCGEDYEVCVKEAYIATVEPGDKFAIPEGYFYTFINTGTETSIISRVYRTYGKVESSLKDVNGLAYFCIRKNARQEVVFNPRYKNIPNIKKTTPDENHFPALDLDIKQSLYDLVKNQTEKFREFLI